MFDWKELEQANKQMQGIDIKGKFYMEVNQRIKAFRMVCPQGSIITEMISNENGVCVFKATVLNEEKTILGTGTAYEKESSTFINKTSYIENCETSAVGRALGMCGFGIDTSIASAEEVTNAINNQKPKETTTKKELTPRQKLLAKLRVLGMDANTYGKQHNITSKTTDAEFEKLLADLCIKKEV